jgi:hypothetical protein
MKRKFTPIRLLIIYLLLLVVIAAIRWAGTEVENWLVIVRNSVLLYASATFAYQILLHVKIAKPTRWEHRIITTAILLLLFDPTTPWWAFIWLGLSTELIQRLVRTKLGPVFNPAATGALLASCFAILPSWWGMGINTTFAVAQYKVDIILVLLPLAILVARSYKKLPTAISFLAVFGTLYWLVFQIDPVPLLIEGTLAFFALIMVIEPKTSPTLSKDQYIFGSITALLTIILFKIGFGEGYLGALIVANGGFAMYRQWQLRKLLK